MSADYVYEGMKRFIAEQEKTRHQTISTLKKFFVDKQYTLEQRWDVYNQACSAGVFYDVQTWYPDFKFMKQRDWTWYDTFNLERYRVQTFVDLVDTIVEMWWGDMAIEYVDGKYVQILTDKEFDEMITKDLDEIKEEILESGLSEFEFDW